MVKRTALAGCFDHNDNNDVGDMKSKGGKTNLGRVLVLDGAGLGSALMAPFLRSQFKKGELSELWNKWDTDRGHLKTVRMVFSPAGRSWRSYGPRSWHLNLSESFEQRKGQRCQNDNDKIEKS